MELSINTLGKEASWNEIIARIGFAAKGLLYLIMGFFAFQVALGLGGKTTGMKGVLKSIIEEAHPFGEILLIAVALGLIGHSYWRLLQSVFNADNKEINFKNIIDRIGFFTSVLIYGGLAYFSFKMIFMGIEAGGSGNSPESLTASVLSKPFGRWLVGLVGLAIGGSGLFQIYFGLFSKFEKKLDLNNINKFEQQIVRYICLFGLVARGIVFALIAVFIIQAAINFNPKQAGGIDQALDRVLNQPFGLWLLGITAAGLAAYGGYCIVLSKFRKIPMND